MVLDFNKKVPLQVGPEPAPKSKYHNEMRIDDWMKKAFDGKSVKNTPGEWYETQISPNFIDENEWQKKQKENAEKRARAQKKREAKERGETFVEEAPAAEMAAPKEETTRAALLFPGQGSQYIGMMKDQASMPAVQEMMAKAKDILGFDVMEKCTSGTEDEIAQTRVCQTIMFIAGLVSLEVLKAQKPEVVAKPMAVAGLSLGEYTALVAAGVLSFEDGLALVKLRAEAMSRAAELKPQSMVSVAGLDRAKLEGICKEAREADKVTPDPVCQIANVLFHQGFTVSGTKATMDTLIEKAQAGGALQARLIKTGGAFHSSLMQPAEVELGKALDDVLPRMKPPTCAVYFNATGKAFPAGTNPSEFIGLMKKQLTVEVLWEQSMVQLVKDGAKEFYECGPMKQLKAMMKRIDQTAWKATENIAV